MLSTPTTSPIIGSTTVLFHNNNNNNNNSNNTTTATKIGALLSTPSSASPSPRHQSIPQQQQQDSIFSPPLTPALAPLFIMQQQQQQQVDANAINNNCSTPMINYANVDLMSMPASSPSITMMTPRDDQSSVSFNDNGSSTNYEYEGSSGATEDNLTHFGFLPVDQQQQQHQHQQQQYNNYQYQQQQHQQQQMHYQQPTFVPSRMHLQAPTNYLSYSTVPQQQQGGQHQPQQQQQQQQQQQFFFVAPAPPTTFQMHTPSPAQTVSFTSHPQQQIAHQAPITVTSHSNNNNPSNNFINLNDHDGSALLAFDDLVSQQQSHQQQSHQHQQQMQMHQVQQQQMHHSAAAQVQYSHMPQQYQHSGHIVDNTITTYVPSYTYTTVFHPAAGPQQPTGQQPELYNINTNATIGTDNRSDSGLSSSSLGSTTSTSTKRSFFEMDDQLSPSINTSNKKLQLDISNMITTANPSSQPYNSAVCLSNSATPTSANGTSNIKSEESEILYSMNNHGGEESDDSCCSIKTLNPQHQQQQYQYNTNPSTTNTTQPQTTQQLIRPTKSPRSFKCPEPGCPKAYTRQSNLNAHVMGSHRQERPHQCPECPKSFVWSHDLSRHIVSMHQREKRFKCGYCGFDFSRSDALKRHLEIERRRLGEML
ncbi:hypothetical protein HDU76_006412 [Blyttiomyces sp. JEL0837]|nr:hypothetical protein HDU76_006412 [Blyttiomyces sp. JEL0837]